MFFRHFLSLIATLFGILLPCATHAQGVGTWYVHASYHNATRTIPAGDYIATLTNGALMLYHPTSGEVSTLSRADGLNGVNIAHIGYATKARTLVLVYADAGIDLLHLPTRTIRHLAQVKQSTWQDKTPRGINLLADTAYISYASGLIVVDVADAAITHSYAIGNVREATPYAGYLFATTTTGIKRGVLTDNLADPANWTTISTLTPTHLGISAGQLYATTTDGIFELQADGTISHEYRDVATFATFSDTAIFYGNAQRVMSYNVRTHQVTYLTADAPTLDMYQMPNGHYAVATGAQGLHIYSQREGNRITGLVGSFTPNSPIRNIAYHTTYDPYHHRIAIAGGQLSYTGADYEGTAMYFDLDHRTWHNLSEAAPTTTGIDYRNTTAIAPLPTSITTTPTYTYAVTTAGNGLYLFNDTTFVAQYDFTNAPLATILPDINPRYFVRLDGCRYDASGNLWLVNNQVDTTLRVLTPTGEWHSIYLPEISKHPTLEKIHIDSNGRIWVLSRRYTASTNGGVLCYTPGDLASTTDDKVTYRSTFPNQDGTTTNIIGVYAIAQETAQNGQPAPIWIGTSHGPYRIDNPDEFGNRDFAYTQVKIARNDGTNQADYLLANVPTTAIAIDGGNRKWFGTDNDGLYIISADGQEVLHHFTTENSPLPSNTISSIAIVPTTGEAFIGTMQGIVSYESGITEAQDNLDADHIKVFPNPYTPTHSGQVMIQGLTAKAEVKITNAAGHLVHVGTSSGGTYLWNTRNQQGQPVPSGVYYLLIATADGQTGTAHPITIIR